MVGNGAIAALVAITAPSGYVETWAAPFIGAVAGVLVVLAIPAIDKLIDDPVGALSAHGLAGIWGTLSCGIFTAPRLADYNAFGVTNSDDVFLGGFLYASGLLGKGANEVPGADSTSRRSSSSEHRHSASRSRSRSCSRPASPRST